MEKFSIKNLLSSKKNAYILTFIGLGGILLIFISSMFPKSKNIADASSSPSMNEYSAALEEKLSSMVKNITGIQDPQVVVTLESGFEYIYADETTANRDKTEETKSGDTKTQEKDSTTQKYITIQGADGRDVALLLTEIAPRIKGVVVVCPGISDESRQQIISALMAALDISSRRIYVTG